MEFVRKLEFTYKKHALLFLIVVVCIIAIRPLFTVYTLRDTLFSRNYHKNFAQLKNIYLHSVYTNKNGVFIADEQFEAYAGGEFLKGLNPILLVHDQPPLGRYITSLSILLFDNASTLSIPLLIFSVIGIVFIGKEVLNNWLLALIPAGIFMNEPLFLSKIIYTPLLEPIQLPFIIFALYFFIRGINSKNYSKWFLLTALMLGFVISIRFFVLGAAELLCMITYFLLNKKIDKKFLTFLAFLPVALVILFLSYTRTIQLGHSLFRVLSIQKYILWYHKSALVLPFSVLDLLLFNRWHTWWGKWSISSDSLWIIAWPISLVLSVCFFIAAVLKKMVVSEAEKVILLWIGAYLLMLLTGYNSTRYFLPLIPFLYIIAFSAIIRVMKTLTKTHTVVYISQHIQKPHVKRKHR